MYFHLVRSPEYFAVASARKSARKVFRRSLELMVLKDHEFGRYSTLPPHAFHPCPFHVGISRCIGKQAIGMFWAAYGLRKPKSFACANAMSVKRRRHNAHKTKSPRAFLFFEPTQRWLHAIQCVPKLIFWKRTTFGRKLGQNGQSPEACTRCLWGVEP